MSELSKYDRYRNRARFLEEVSHGVYELMRRQGRNKVWLARELGKSKSFITKILSGSHNATLETIADVYLALGRTVHLSLSESPEMRLPSDQQEGLSEFRTFAAEFGRTEHVGSAEYNWSGILSAAQGARRAREPRDRYRVVRLHAGDNRSAPEHSEIQAILSTN